MVRLLLLGLALLSINSSRISWAAISEDVIKGPQAEAAEGPAVEASEGPPANPTPSPDLLTRDELPEAVVLATFTETALKGHEDTAGSLTPLQWAEQAIKVMEGGNEAQAADAATALAAVGPRGRFGAGGLGRSSGNITAGGGTDTGGTDTGGTDTGGTNGETASDAVTSGTTALSGKTSLVPVMGNVEAVNEVVESLAEPGKIKSNLAQIVGNVQQVIAAGTPDTEETGAPTFQTDSAAPSVVVDSSTTTAETKPVPAGKPAPAGATAPPVTPTPAGNPQVTVDSSERRRDTTQQLIAAQNAGLIQPSGSGSGTGVAKPVTVAKKDDTAVKLKDTSPKTPDPKAVKPKATPPDPKAKRNSLANCPKACELMTYLRSTLQFRTTDCKSFEYTFKLTIEPSMDSEQEKILKDKVAAIKKDDNCPATEFDPLASPDYLVTVKWEQGSDKTACLKDYRSLLNDCSGEKELAPLPQDHQGPPPVKTEPDVPTPAG